MDDDPHLINVSAHRATLQKDVDDILWDAGVNDPRLGALIAELNHFTKLDEQGIPYEPDF